MMSTQTESINLYYREGRSDKVYQVQLVNAPTGFVVNFQYGRRNSALQSGTKTAEPVPYAKAKQIYDGLVREKKSKGYTQGEDGTPYQGSDMAHQQSGILPALLNPIDEQEVERLIADDDWHLQRKMDGCRLMVRRNGETIEGIDRNGKFVALARVVEDAVRDLERDVLLDGEIVGCTYWAFDLLELDAFDLRSTAMADRFNELSALFQGQEVESALQIVAFATTTGEKRSLFERLKRQRAEGVVFKRRAAEYACGRPNSGGDYLKFKFTATATCKVVRRNADKRSVGLAVRENDGSGLIEIGNVTIPRNFPIPPDGALVEVRYLYAYVQGSLYQPVYLGERHDVASADAFSSLKFKQGEDDEAVT
jgi:bifunctional non-homologous end joining protein LigD